MVSAYQHAFMEGKLNFDAVLIANEAIDSSQRRTSQVGRNPSVVISWLGPSNDSFNKRGRESFPTSIVVVLMGSSEGKLLCLGSSMGYSSNS
ncbi:hypothetical protein CK203_106993 [Vitis vinifera]|uniref:Uncharacterized protein n=1 Tax=Vitis vinifera TaxID=29760 RepID=A0A438CVZ7_VITVI|nr:hypothetical protein CK203_106993 [Vitis vinifera]